jgi:hypothetical protein
MNYFRMSLPGQLSLIGVIEISRIGIFQDCSRVTLVLFRTRRRDECLRLQEVWGVAFEPSEGSRWRGGRGTYAN